MTFSFLAYWPLSVRVLIIMLPNEDETFQLQVATTLNVLVYNFAAGYLCERAIMTNSNGI